MHDTYAVSGVDYELLDAFKRACQAAAQGTQHNAEHLGFREIDGIRGESAYLLGHPGILSPFMLAHAEEELGTASVVAKILFEKTGISYEKKVAQSAVAAITNDVSAIGAIPFLLAMRFAIGNSAWLRDTARWRQLIDGWTEGAHTAGCVWGGGETPALKDVIGAKEYALGGSCVGIVPPKSAPFSGGNISERDSILLFKSSGPHSNGFSLIRSITEFEEGWIHMLSRLLTRRKMQRSMPREYFNQLPDGGMFGVALLEPAIFYTPLVNFCLKERIPVHYAVHITGHGWRKLMRANALYDYVIERIPDVPPVFEYIQEYGNLSDREAYAIFNMGAGFALYLPSRYVSRVLGAAETLGISGFEAGFVRQGTSGGRRVLIGPKGIIYGGDSLAVR